MLALPVASGNIHIVKQRDAYSSALRLSDMLSFQS